MRNHWRTILALCAAAAVWLGPAAALAQTDDPLMTIPDVLIVFDTSGSMSTAALRACCNANPFMGPATCMLTDICVAPYNVWQTNIRSRFTAAQEVLTGTFNPPYTDWDSPVGSCPAQYNDGVLDLYRDFVRFAYSGYDWEGSGAGGYAGGNYDAYGPDKAKNTPRSWGHGFKGRRTSNTDTDRCRTGHGCLIDLVDKMQPDDLLSNNESVQTEVCKARYVGGTPIAASLHDARHYFLDYESQLGYHDPFGRYDGNCRPQFVLLMTDGQEWPGCQTHPLADEGWSTGNCSYYGNEAVQAEKLCNDIGVPVFVVGFGDMSLGERTDMHRIMRAGQCYPRADWTAAEDPFDDIPEAFIAVDPLSLKIAFAMILDSILAGTVSRTESATSPSSIATDTAFQYKAWFEMSIVGITWSGYLAQEELRDINNDGVAEVINTIALAPPWVGAIAGVDVTKHLKAVGSRKLLTIVSDPRSQGFNDPAAYQLPRFENLAPLQDGLFPFKKSVPLPDNAIMCLVDMEALGPVVLAETIKDYVNGEWLTLGASGLRASLGPQLGDVFHASPVPVPPPSPLTPDFRYEAYFRENMYRPTMLYVGANDGFLHGFAVQDNDPTNLFDGGNFTVFDELWAFMPTNLLAKIQKIRWGGHSFFVDSSPVIRDVYFHNMPLPDGDPTTATCMKDGGGTCIKGAYRTVLLGGERAGGDTYYALDVTDPRHPGYLWEYRTGQQLNANYIANQCRSSALQTWAQPLVGQVWLKKEATSEYLARSVAVLPGGYLPRQSFKDVTSCIELMQMMVGASAVHVLDIETGRVLRKFRFSTNPALQDLEDALEDFEAELAADPHQNFNHWGGGTGWDSGDYNWPARTGWECAEKRGEIQNVPAIPAGLLDPAFCDVIMNSGNIAYEQKCCWSPPAPGSKCNNMNAVNTCSYQYTEYTDGSFHVWLKTEGCALSPPENRGRFELSMGTNFRTESVAATPVAYNTALGEFISRLFVVAANSKAWRINMDNAAYDEAGAEGAMVVPYASGEDWVRELFYDPTDAAFLNPPLPVRPATASPALALNEKRNLLLIYGTGELDDLGYSPTKHDYLFAVEEERVFDGVDRYVPKPTGTLRSKKTNFAPSERLFGQPLVVSGKVYFTTFTPDADACSTGSAKIYALNYEDFADESLNQSMGSIGTPSSPVIRWTATGAQAVFQSGKNVVELPGGQVISPAAHVMYWGTVL